MKTDGTKNKRPEGQIEEVLGIFGQLLPSEIVSKMLEETGKVYYVRLLPPLLTLWGFIFQRLNSDHSCDAAWSHLSSDPIQERFGRKGPCGQRSSESTSAYCQARQRLPKQVAEGALQTTADRLAEQMGEAGLWHGQRVNLFDGSNLVLQATPALRERYGAPRNQHGDQHWPQMRIVAGFDYFSGAVNGVAEGPYTQSEHPLAVQLIRSLGSNWIHVGDRYLGAYHILQAVSAAHSQAVLRLNERTAKCLAEAALQPDCDLDVVWQVARYDHVEPGLPTLPMTGRLLYVRLQKDGFRPIDLYLFTTLTDRQAFPLTEIVSLYGERWNIELDLRHVKTTLRMNSLDGKSVEMVQKELLLGLLAYNLIRGLMGIAALQAGVRPCQLSLAMCWRRIIEAGRFLPANPAPEELQHVLSVLLARLGRCLLLKRKRERFEPRAVWGRPQVFPKIKSSREQSRLAQLQLLKNKS